jgi:hypothetical protein
MKDRGERRCDAAGLTLLVLEADEWFVPAKVGRM